ncbi:MAG: NAD(P)/FAD-dependent oxidoreductase [Candidatus Lokiarchaeota archaeon]|nr:NAD(P)/FAD-dependent oxidoreductase [Candidatus Lokiarchaeota archaeon]
MDRSIEKFDVCIVGGSIAGNYLSFLLSKTNLKIAVIEEHKKIGIPLQCAGIVSQKLSKLIQFPEEIILNRVKVAKIVAPHGKFIKISSTEEPYIIDRIALDRFFYETVQNTKSIHYFTDEKFKSFKNIKDGNQNSLKIETSRRFIISKLLIGCDGPLSSVAKSLGVKNRNLYATQIRITGNFDETEAVMYFHPKWKESFGWIVPEGNDTFRIGLASSQNLKKNFKIFIKQLKLDLNRKIDRQGGLIPYGTMNKLAFNNILLLGDSACQVKATTGGGIIMLLTAANYAANCIQRCFKHETFSKKFIKKYYELPCLASIGKELKTHYLIRVLIERLSSKDFIKLFRILRTNKMEYLINLYGDMDFPKRFIFKILRNPFVVSFLIKFIFRNPDIIVKFLRILPM